MKEDDGVNRFYGWPTQDLAAQCKMQAREGLDPDLTKFMLAVALRLEVLEERTRL